MRASGQKGFTIAEMLIALLIGSMLVSTVISVFVILSRSYRDQLMIAALEQNLRAGMDMLTRDIRMAGFLLNVSEHAYPGFYDFDPRHPGADDLFPFIQGLSDLEGLPHYREKTDVLVIAKAGSERRRLLQGEAAPAGENFIILDNLDLDARQHDDLNEAGKRLGALVKRDLSAAELFRIQSVREHTVIVERAFAESYQPGDIIARADLIIYRVDDRNATFDSPVLARKNAGNGDSFQVVAENITDLQLVYLLRDGSEAQVPDGLESLIRGVHLRLEGEILLAQGKKIRRVMQSMVTVRNPVG